MRAALPTIPVLHSEWIKIRSLRGTLGSFISVLVATAGIQTLTAALIGTAEEGSMGDDPLLAAFYGLNFGQIAAIAFGASAFSAEFHNGGLRTSLAAVPDRTRFYLSKISIVGGLALVMGQITGLLTFLGGQAFMGPYALEPGAPGTVRAVVGCGLYLTLMTLFAMRPDGGAAQRDGCAEHPHTVRPAGLLRRLRCGERNRAVHAGPRRADGAADGGAR